MSSPKPEEAMTNTENVPMPRVSQFFHPTAGITDYGGYSEALETWGREGWAKVQGLEAKVEDMTWRLEALHEFSRSNPTFQAWCDKQKAERDALKANLEAAERELAEWTRYMGSECTPKSLSEAADEDQRTMHRLLIGKEKAESRAEALAEALGNLADNFNEAGDPPQPWKDMIDSWHYIARAALEGK